MTVEEICSDYSLSIELTTGISSSSDQFKDVYLRLNPQEIFKLVTRSLYIKERWKIFTVDKRSNPSSQQIISKMLRYIENKPPELFQRLGMFRCWTDTAKRMRFSDKNIPPASYPNTPTTASEAGKWNLYHYVKFAKPLQDLSSVKYILDKVSRDQFYIVREKLWLNYLRSSSSRAYCQDCEDMWDTFTVDKELHIFQYFNSECRGHHSMVERKQIVDNISLAITTVDKIINIIPEISSVYCKKGPDSIILSISERNS